jgi:[mycofactocin precursor peptide]-tyrosine decarboxylase / 3-amino-5-[(4-hydroxyphenyl)methyl]-4,4-dimethylpyrrolidin-2-one synthase
MYYDRLRRGLSAPICLTWEMTYACNLRCVHCLSSSGKRAPGELTTEEAKRLLDDWARMQVFYINVGGGEPMTRRDFFDLMEYSIDHGIGVKFSTNGTLIDAAAADWIASTDYLDVQISLDGATPEVNDAIRGAGAYGRAQHAMQLLSERGVRFKINTVLTRRSFVQLDALYGMASGYGGELRVTRLRPSGRGTQVWSALRLTQAQNRSLYDWLLEHPDVLTGDSFFHLSALGKPLDGMNMCGAGRIVCCVDPVGDVYACPFVLVPEFKAGNIRDSSFAEIWHDSELFRRLRQWEVGGSCTECPAYSKCHGGCMAAKFFTGIPLDDPDPECVFKPEVATTDTIIPLTITPRPIAATRSR